MGESLTVKVGSTSIVDLSFVVLYVHVPWTGSRSFQQIFVLYQVSQRQYTLSLLSSESLFWASKSSFMISSSSRSTIQILLFLRIYLWWSLCSWYSVYVLPHACHVRVTVGDSGLCCCVCVTYFESQLTPVYVVKN